MSTEQLWTDLTARWREIKLVEQLRGVVSWDQQTYMPAGAAAGRGEQIAWLMRQAHDRVTDPRFGEVVQALLERAGELSADQRAGLRNIERHWRRDASVPAALVERLGQLQGEGFAAWMQARNEGDFAILAPVLEELVSATRERALVFAPDGDAYAAMVDEFDPGVTLPWLDSTFGRLREGLGTLLDAIRGTEPMPVLGGQWDTGAQLKLARTIATALGFDVQRGRLDESEHPFTVTLGASDVRFTTKADPDDLLLVLGGTIHETGHALYEQGLPRELSGTGLATAASMGLHESQSRFWENGIGRSLAFCAWLQGPLREAFGDDAPSAERLYRASNRVEAGLIRVTADEVTYNLHVAIRYDIERRLFSGDLTVADLPGAWREAYARDLGVDVPDDKVGVLQDVHWSGGAFGYFPSYTLGNLYSASFAQALRADVPDLDDQVRAGRFEPIVDWLRDRIHRHGHRWDAPELVTRVVGERDPVDDLLAHLWSRHGALHGV